LPGIYTTTDDKELRKESKPAQVKDNDVLGLFIIGYPGEQLDDFFRL